jgi:hypothetical protein
MTTVTTPTGQRQTDENGVLRQFRSWVGQQMTSGGTTPPTP